MTWMTRIRRRGLVTLAIFALTLVLALSACGARGAGRHGGSSGAGQQTTGQSSGSTGSSSGSSELQNADQQIQNAVSSMDNAQSTAASDSGSDPSQQP